MSEQPQQPPQHPQQPPQPGYGYPGPGAYPGADQQIPGQPGQPGQPGGPQGGPYQQGYDQAGYQQPGYQQQGYQQGYQQPGYGYPGAVPPPPPGMGMGYPGDPNAPYGYDPYGRPYSEKSKIVAGVLQLLLGTLGVGRFYIGNVGIGLAQLFTCGGLGIWALIDGIIMLTSNNTTDSDGRVLRGG